MCIKGVKKVSSMFYMIPKIFINKKKCNSFHYEAFRFLKLDFYENNDATCILNRILKIIHWKLSI